ncbi:MAG: hypothetical protein K5681_04895 [Treponema sp.]|nr:hypothetical protein [Treponema sp.]
MLKYKRFYLYFFVTLFANFIFAEDYSLIYKTLDARLATRLCPTSDQAIASMDSLRKAYEDQGILTGQLTEAELIIDNMISLERYNYMYEKDLESPDLKPYILAQYDKINDYVEKHEGKKFSPWFILSSGDVINSSMQFIPQATAIKQGLKEKEDYDKVLEENPDLAFGLINAALWYYFAPAIGGGSKEKAKSYLEHAVSCAACDYEAFYSRIYLSQIYYDNGLKEDASKLLNECDEILSDTKYISFIRFLNDNNYSLLYYTNNRGKVEKKLGL